MKIVGIAAEYNPFHNGHKYHIEKTKELTGCDASVCVMSGFFTQRGEPAITNKWSRAAAAVQNGIDLVLELPFAYACNGAGYFAQGAAAILDGLGCIDVMSFGSEAGDIKLLTSCAEAVVKKSFEGRDKTYARRLGEVFDDNGLSSDANNILAVEYIKALNNIGSGIKPFTIRRQGEGYHIDGASSIREKLYKGQPANELMPSLPDIDWDGNTELIFKLAASEILKQPAEVLDSVPSGGEGLGFKLKNEIRRCTGLGELISRVKETRYTRARISRMLMQIIMGLYQMPVCGLYGRVLAFNDTGAQILKMIKKNETARNGFMIINNINKQDTSAINPLLSFDIRACDMYNLIVGHDLYSNADMVKGPVKINCR